MSERPETIGPFKILSELGRSYDAVYEATDTRNGNVVALKAVTRSSFTSDEQFRNRAKSLLREAKLVASLTHPNILGVSEFGEAEGAAYMVMERLFGRTLLEEREACGMIPQSRAIEIAASVLAALSSIHKRGILHRDLKPENVFLCDDGRILLTDFGFARIPFAPDIVPLTGCVGTPEYMSPEQTAGQDVDTRSDIFSLGVVLYEMLAGKQLFRGETIHAVSYAVTYKHPPKPEGAGDAIWRVLQRALAKKPELRYRDSDEMRNALHQVAELEEKER